MDDINAMLASKLKEKSQLKLKTLAERNPEEGSRGLLPQQKLSKLTHQEADALADLLAENAPEKVDISRDLTELKQLTEEVKSINTQAIILHGERIKKAQSILKEYREGTFTSWLLQTYGNRQTPYNFLQYFEFYQALTQSLREKMLDMPKQAVYTLASRSGDLDEKTPFVETYQGETKDELLSKIRKAFPLKAGDKRKENFTSTVCSTLSKLLQTMRKKRWQPTQEERERVNTMLTEILSYVEE